MRMPYHARGGQRTARPTTAATGNPKPAGKKFPAGSFLIVASLYERRTVAARKDRRSQTAATGSNLCSVEPVARLG